MNTELIAKRLPLEVLRLVEKDYVGLLHQMAIRIQLAWGRYKGCVCRDCWKVHSSKRRLMTAMTCDLGTACCFKFVCRQGCRFYCRCGSSLLDLCPQVLFDEPDETGYLYLPDLYLQHCRYASRWAECPEGCGVQVFVRRKFDFLLWLPFR